MGHVTRALGEIGLSVKRLQMRHHVALNHALSPLGLSIVQWDALRHIGEQPDASLHDLAQLTFQSDQAFGTLAGRMIERGLIERLAGPGRAVRHRLTARGAALRQDGAAIVNEVLAESFGTLTPEQLATFDDLLTRLFASTNVVGPHAQPHRR